jgi:hypothetical protein
MPTSEVSAQLVKDPAKCRWVLCLRLPKAKHAVTTFTLPDELLHDSPVALMEWVDQKVNYLVAIQPKLDRAELARRIVNEIFRNTLASRAWAARDGTGTSKPTAAETERQRALDELGIKSIDEDPLTGQPYPQIP